MPTKRYIVREGFNFRIVDAKNNEKVYSEGDIVTLEQDIGDAAHQLEYAEEKDRAAAAKAEESRARAQKADQPAAAGGSVVIDHEALAAAIAQGIAAAFQAQQEPAAAEDTGGAGDGSKAS